MKSLTSLLLASWLVGAFGLLVPPSTLAAELAAHRASYLLTLGRSQSGSDIVDVRGVMSYEFTDACDGWTTVQKARMKFLYEDGRAIETGWNLNSWESKDGGRYRFFMRNFDGETVTSEIKGEAEQGAGGGAGMVHFEVPKAKQLTLPRGTLFPTAHSRALLQRAAAGDATFFATVFDGSDDKGPVDISAVLAGHGAPSAESAKLSPLLATGPVYRLGLAFYELGGNDSTPEQEQAVSLYANGVIDRLTLDFGSFTVDAVLKKLEALPASGC
jgi:hypothetical protein